MKDQKKPQKPLSGSKVKPESLSSSGGKEGESSKLEKGLDDVKGKVAKAMEDLDDLGMKDGDDFGFVPEGDEPMKTAANAAASKTPSIPVVKAPEKKVVTPPSLEKKVVTPPSQEKKVLQPPPLDQKVEKVEVPKPLAKVDPPKSAGEKVDPFAEVKKEVEKVVPPQSDRQAGQVVEKKAEVKKVEVPKKEVLKSDVRTGEGRVSSPKKPVEARKEAVKTPAKKVVAEKVDVLEPVKEKTGVVAVQPTQKVSKWAFWKRRSKRDEQLASISAGYTEMVDLLRGIRGQLETQNGNQELLRESLVHLPKAMQGLDQFSETQQSMSVALKGIHGQMEKYATSGEKLATSMDGVNDTLKGIDDTSKATMRTFDRMQERMRDSDIRMEGLFQNVQSTVEIVYDGEVAAEYGCDADDFCSLSVGCDWGFDFYGGQAEREERDPG